MNRPTAILVALATLLAHVLALHQDVEGTFAPPYEIAHVAYRIGRNLVHDGSLAWTIGTATVESYPSPLWIVLAAFFEALRVAPTLGTQYVGIACVLATVVVLAQFSAHRLAGLIALLLFVVTGTTAAAAASGTEYPLVMLLVAAALLAFERRSTPAAAVALSLLVVARNDLGVLVLGLLAAELLGARRRRAAGERVLVRAFFAPAATFAVLVALRLALVGHALSPLTRDLLHLDLDRVRLGADYVLSFYLRSGAAALVVFPAWYLLRGQLSGTGRRAMLLVVLWSAFVALAGGDRLPFWMAMAPAVPLLFLAVQEAMILAMDSRRPGLAPATWIAFVLGIVASGLVSRVPADVGGLPLRKLQIAWMTPSERYVAATGRRYYGRRGLMQEIEETDELRSLGVFLRERLDLGSTILSPWPGAAGYISRQTVVDLLGRASAPADGSRQRSWYGTPRLDLVAALASGADYVVPAATTGTAPPKMAEVVQRWITQHHVHGVADAGAALDALRAYELVSVPVPRKSYLPEESSPRPFYLLRRRALGARPRVALERAPGGAFDVFAWHDGHQQVIDLEVELELADGTLRRLRPTGEFVDSDLVHARAGVLLHPIGEMPIHLVRFHAPPGVQSGELRAVLQNPNSGADPFFSLVSNQAVLRF